MLTGQPGGLSQARWTPPGLAAQPDGWEKEADSELQAPRQPLRAGGSRTRQQDQRRV